MHEGPKKPKNPSPIRQDLTELAQGFANDLIPVISNCIPEGIKQHSKDSETWAEENPAEAALLKNKPLQRFEQAIQWARGHKEKQDPSQSTLSKLIAWPTSPLVQIAWPLPPQTPGQEPDSNTSSTQPDQEPEPQQPNAEPQEPQENQDQQPNQQTESEAYEAPTQATPLTPIQTAQEKHDAQIQLLDESICAEYDIDPNFALEYRQLEAQAWPYVRSLVEIFKQALKQEFSVLDQEISRRCQSGNFNVNDFIASSVTAIATGSYHEIDYINSPWHDRTQEVIKPGIRPQGLLLDLAIDISGSTDPRKYPPGIHYPEALKEVMISYLPTVKLLSVIFMLTCDEFEQCLKPYNAELRRMGVSGQNLLTSKARFWTYDSFARLAKDFTTDDKRVELANRFKFLQGIVSDGITRDDLVLDLIAAKRDKFLNENQQKGLPTHLAYVVCDGNSTHPSITRGKRQKLEELGMSVKAFQIGDPNLGETFQNTYGPDNSMVLPDCEQIIEVVTFALKEQLRQARLLENKIN